MKIWINRAGQNLGTFTLEEVQRGLDQGQYVPGDLGWQEGMETWKPLAEFPGLQMPQPRVESSSLAPALQTSPEVPPPLVEKTLATIEGEEDGPAWERRQQLGLFKALTQTWKEILFNPNVAFARMKTSGGFTAPFLFNLAMVIIWAFFTVIYRLLLSGMFVAAGSMRNDSSSMMGIGSGASVLVVIGVIVVGIPMMLAFNFLNAGITHLCLALFKGTSKNYEATYRVMCYSYSAWIFALVPCAGGIVAGIWALVSSIIGLSKVHKTENWRAAVGVLLPLFVCAGLVMALYVAIFAAIYSSFHNGNAN
jgi:hypothetical protein